MAYRFLLRGGMGADPEVDEIVRRTRQAFIDRIVAGTGAEPDQPLPRYLGIGWVGMVEAVSLEWLERGDVEPAELVELLAKAAVGIFSPVAAAAGTIGAAPDSG